MGTQDVQYQPELLDCRSDIEDKSSSWLARLLGIISGATYQSSCCQKSPIATVTHIVGILHPFDIGMTASKSPALDIEHSYFVLELVTDSNQTDTLVGTTISAQHLS